MKKTIITLLVVILTCIPVGNVQISAEPYITNGYLTIDVKAGYNTYETTNSSYYLSYEAKATGSILMTFDGNPGGITVQDIKCQPLTHAYEPISPTKKGTNYTFEFGVKKGITYLFYVDTGSDSPDKFNLTIKNTPIKYNNLSRKKARKIKLKKTVSGIIPLGTDSPVWFKYKFKKTKKCTIALNMKSIFGSYDLQIYRGKKVIASTSMSASVFKNWNPFTKIKTSNENVKYLLKKGTYYIKVTKYNPIASGKFTIKVK